VAKAGRRPGQSQTRAAILDAARAQFAARGFRGTTVRSVAAAAAVHPALLHHYFRSKRQLYTEALGLTVDPWEVLSRLLDDTPRELLPEALVRHWISSWRDPETGQRLCAMARDYFTAPDSMARAHTETLLIPQFARQLQIPQGNVAAALAHLNGLVLADALLHIRQLNDLDEDALVALVAPSIRTYLFPS
jgi:AcrR family transcriptional regulator